MCELTERLKKRFCKDYNLSLQLFDEPFFSERVELLGKKDKLDKFVTLLSKYKTEEEFFEYNNIVRDSIIDYIKASTAFQALNADDMNKYALPEKYRNLQKTDVYKVPNIGKHFLCVDLSKANFSALVHYAKATGTEFFNSYNWADFMDAFTDIWYFVESKYIRQVVFGNCNPKRQIGYESYLITKWLEDLEKIVGDLKINSIHADEVIFDAEDMDLDTRNQIIGFAENADIPLHADFFRLAKITNSDAYVKYIFDTSSGVICNKEVKCIQPWEAPAIYRMLKGEKPCADDLYFDFNGRLAKFETPVDYDITFNIGEV